MRKQTTIRIFTDQALWIKKCCEAYKMSTSEFIEEFEKHTRAKKLQHFYNSLPMPQKYIRQEKKIKSKPYKICMQIGVAT